MVDPSRVRHVTRSKHIDRDLMAKLFERADAIQREMDACRRLGVPINLHLLRGYHIGLLFYEPSTRTRMSFETAISRMGGTYTSTENAGEFSSAVKGESLEHTAEMMSGYVDAVVVRHKENLAADRMASVSRIPVINAGDGTGQHPTQALLDVFTIKKELGKVDNLKVVIVGDLAHGRTANSLAYMLGTNCDKIEMVFVSPPSLRIKQGVKDHLKARGISFREQDTLNDLLPEADVVYMTRLQKERMTEEERKTAQSHRLVIDEGNLQLMRKSARLLHPLPIPTELGDPEISLPSGVEAEDQRVAYIRQAGYGVAVRAALLEDLLRHPFNGQGAP